MENKYIKEYTLSRMVYNKDYVEKQTNNFTPCRKEKVNIIE